MWRASSLSKRLLLACSAIALALPAGAQQVLRMKDGETQSAKISAKEVSRVAIEGARVRSIVGARGEYDVQVDKDIGQVFIRPMVASPAPINMFVTDDSGHTFGLVLVAEDIPAESIVIAGRAEPGGSAQAALSQPYPDMIKDLVRAMALNEAQVNGCEVNEHGRKVPIWNEVELSLERTWECDGIVGERYTLVNITAGELRLAEQEFLRRGVLAIALDNAALAPRQSTGVYVVREAPHGR
jgi:conjugal transfer pilus assembly protein TraK